MINEGGHSSVGRIRDVCYFSSLICISTLSGIEFGDTLTINRTQFNHLIWSHSKSIKSLILCLMYRQLCNIGLILSAHLHTDYNTTLIKVIFQAGFNAFVEPVRLKLPFQSCCKQIEVEFKRWCEVASQSELLIINWSRFVWNSMSRCLLFSVRGDDAEAATDLRVSHDGSA